MNKRLFIAFLIALPFLWVGSWVFGAWQDPGQNPPEPNLPGPVWLLPTITDDVQEISGTDKGKINMSGQIKTTGNLDVDSAVITGVSNPANTLSVYQFDSAKKAIFGVGGGQSSYGVYGVAGIGGSAGPPVTIGSYAVYGTAAALPYSYAVYGSATNATSWAGYFDERVFAEKYCLGDPADPDCIETWSEGGIGGALWTQEGTTNNIFKGTATNIAGIVSIGTASPSTFPFTDQVKLGIYGDSPRIYLDGNTAVGAPLGNPEIDLKLSSSANDHWAIYADETSRQLRFWAKEGAGTPAGQGRNNIALTSDGVMIFAGWGTLVPKVTTNLPSGVTSLSATLNATINPRGDTTTAWFRFYTDANQTLCDATGEQIPTVKVSAGSGTTDYILTAAKNGLTPENTYSYCALAENGSGLSVGQVLHFTASANTLTATTNAANPIGSLTATLNGSFNPDGFPSTAWFKWSINKPADINVGDDCLYEWNTDTIWGAPVGLTVSSSSTTDVSFTYSLTGLVKETTYYYCAFAKNDLLSKTAAGKLQSFKTSNLPGVSFLSASNITISTATVSATFYSNASISTVGWFKYSKSSFDCATAVANGTTIWETAKYTWASGTNATGSSYSQSLSGLTPDTTYNYCAIITNSNGTGVASGTFKTNQAIPAVTTLAASNTNYTSATLNGSANPNGVTTTGWFRYSTTNPVTCNDTFGTRLPAVSGGVALGSGGTAVSFLQNITSGLTANATYFYCAIASNSNGINFGSVVSFVAAPLPAVTTLGTTLTANSGTVTFRGSQTAATSAYFRYGTASATCGSLPTVTPTISNPAANFSHTRTLICKRTYWVCAVGSNTTGTTFGNVVSFYLPECIID